MTATAFTPRISRVAPTVLMQEENMTEVMTFHSGSRTPCRSVLAPLLHQPFHWHFILSPSHTQTAAASCGDNSIHSRAHHTSQSYDPCVFGVQLCVVCPPPVPSNSASFSHQVYFYSSASLLRHVAGSDCL